MPLTDALTELRELRWALEERRWHWGGVDPHLDLLRKVVALKRAEQVLTYVVERGNTSGIFPLLADWEEAKP